MESSIFSRLQKAAERVHVPSWIGLLLEAAELLASPRGAGFASELRELIRRHQGLRFDGEEVSLHASPHRSGAVVLETAGNLISPPEPECEEDVTAFYLPLARPGRADFIASEGGDAVELRRTRKRLIGIIDTSPPVATGCPTLDTGDPDC